MLALGLLGELLELADHDRDGLVDATLQVHRAVTSGDQLEPFLEDGSRQHGSGGGAVACLIGGLTGHLAHHFGAHVLEFIGELDLLGDRHSILGDGGGAEGLLDDDVAPLGAQGHGYGIAQGDHAAQNGLARWLVEGDLFGWHKLSLGKSGLI